MTRDEFITSIKFELTGDVLELEIEDEAIGKAVDKTLKEDIQKYINETKLITIPYAKCIDLKDFAVSSIDNVYRTNGYTASIENSDGISDVDPMYTAQWMVYANGYSMYNLNNWILNYASYNTLLQMKNTTSTDLAFKYDKHDDKLYITVNDLPSMITVEYVPIFKDVEEVKSDYWQNMILRLAVANIKIILGRIRSRFTQSQALWTQDGDKMLEEGTEERKNIIEQLTTNSQITYGLD